jgi:hypothetical protein
MALAIGWESRPFVGDCGGGLNSGMKRRTHKFKVGQQVYHNTVGLPGGKRTGPYTVIGPTWQPNGTMLYRIKSATSEQLAHESELKLALLRAKKSSD